MRRVHTVGERGGVERRIDARGVPYRALNDAIREAVAAGAERIRVAGVGGQRYIGAGLRGRGVRIEIEGIPGNDLAFAMDGPTIVVRGNAQDACANTMGDGEVVVHGLAGDVLGYGMRGGRLLVRDDVGYRVGIHMKGYRERSPVIVIGGRAGNFLAEYMAGGIIVVLGRGTPEGRSPVGDYLGTGMHGGVVYVRGRVDPARVGREVEFAPAGEEDLAVLRREIEAYERAFQIDLGTPDPERFARISPRTSRPYGKLYTPCR